MKLCISVCLRHHQIIANNYIWIEDLNTFVNSNGSWVYPKLEQKNFLSVGVRWQTSLSGSLIK